jgi:hypothetical protein
MIALLIGVFSLIQASISGRSAWKLPPGGAKPVLLGGFALAVQGMMVGVSLAFFNDPAGVNVVYGSRGLWSLIMVWFLGRWFGNAERHSSRDALLWRAAGALLITAAVALAATGRK